MRVSSSTGSLRPIRLLGIPRTYEELEMPSIPVHAERQRPASAPGPGLRRNASQSGQCSTQTMHVERQRPASAPGAGLRRSASQSGQCSTQTNMCGALRASWFRSATEESNAEKNQWWERKKSESIAQNLSRVASEVTKCVERDSPIRRPVHWRDHVATGGNVPHAQSQSRAVPERIPDCSQPRFFNKKDVASFSASSQKTRPERVPDCSQYRTCNNKGTSTQTDASFSSSSSQRAIPERVTDCQQTRACYNKVTSAQIDDVIGLHKGQSRGVETIAPFSSSSQRARLDRAPRIYSNGTSMQTDDISCMPKLSKAAIGKVVLACEDIEKSLDDAESAYRCINDLCIEEHVKPIGSNSFSEKVALAEEQTIQTLIDARAFGRYVLNSSVQDCGNRNQNVSVQQTNIRDSSGERPCEERTLTMREVAELKRTALTDDTLATSQDGWDQNFSKDHSSILNSFELGTALDGESLSVHAVESPGLEMNNRMEPAIEKGLKDLDDEEDALCESTRGLEASPIAADSNSFSTRTLGDASWCAQATSMNDSMETCQDSCTPDACRNLGPQLDNVAGCTDSMESLRNWMREKLDAPKQLGENGKLSDRSSNGAVAGLACLAQEQGSRLQEQHVLQKIQPELSGINPNRLENSPTAAEERLNTLDQSPGACSVNTLANSPDNSNILRFVAKEAVQECMFHSERNCQSSPTFSSIDSARCSKSVSSSCQRNARMFVGLVEGALFHEETNSHWCSQSSRSVKSRGDGEGDDDVEDLRGIGQCVMDLFAEGCHSHDTSQLEEPPRNVGQVIDKSLQKHAEVAEQCNQSSHRSESPRDCDERLQGIAQRVIFLISEGVDWRDIVHVDEPELMCQ